jgi:FRG domain
MGERQRLRELGSRKLGVADDAGIELSAVETTRWGQLWAPDNLRELVAVAEHAYPAPLDGWRGHADIDWRLDSGAVRRLLQAEPWLRGSPECLEDEVQGYETQLLYNARLAGHGHHEGRQLGDLELLAMLQHHGAATRLLDFTETSSLPPGSPVKLTLRGLGCYSGSTSVRHGRSTTPSGSGVVLMRFWTRQRGASPGGRPRLCRGGYRPSTLSIFGVT